MQYLTSRSWDVPTAPDPLWSGETWFFNMWSRQHWPYKQLKKDDILYVLDTKLNAVKWKVTVSRCLHHAYTSLDEGGDWLDVKMPTPVAREQKWFRDAPAKGVLLAFEVRPMGALHIVRKPGLRLPRIGWIKEPEELMKWVS